MADNTLAPLRRIAAFVSTMAAEGPRAFFLYAEAARAVSCASIYQEFYDRAVWISPPPALFDLLLELWEEAEDDQKWGTLLLATDGTTFSAKFDYERRLDVEDDLHDYRKDALLQRYGNKPIIYPSALSDATEWSAPG